jgi:2-keto-3-deoxy-L-fuconate dehydrogenase
VLLVEVLDEGGRQEKVSGAARPGDHPLPSRGRGHIKDPAVLFDACPGCLIMPEGDEPHVYTCYFRAVSTRRRFDGKVCIVTGAGSGIGRATAQAFADEGALVVVADEDLAAANSTCQGRPACYPIQADVSQSQSVDELIRATRARYRRLDILCNNAGISSTKSVVECEPEEWDRVFAVNVRGVYLGCKHAIPVMIEQGGGVIVNTASVAGLVGLPQRAAYCASKGAVISLTKQIAIEYAKQKIRCNCICPGTVDTPWVARLLGQAPDQAAMRRQLVDRQPMGRLGTAEEIAQAALYLASDDAAFVTGTAFVIDGGLVAG